MFVMQRLPGPNQIKFVAGGRRELIRVMDAFTIEKDAEQLVAFLQNGAGKL